MNKPYVYLGGDIMSHGSNLARQEEYDKIMALDLDAEIYSPVANKDINDKNMPGLTMKQKITKNNHLAEGIVGQDVDRMKKSDVMVMCPEQNAIGSLVETGILYGWVDLAADIKDMIVHDRKDKVPAKNTLDKIEDILEKHLDRKYFFHYEDIRDTDIPEVGWRRSFSINQFLYGVVLMLTNDEGFKKFNDVLAEISFEVPHKDTDEEEPDWDAMHCEDCRINSDDIYYDGDGEPVLACDDCPFKDNLGEDD